MDTYEAAITHLAPAISDLARKGYRETGRGFVVATFSPDNTVLRWFALDGNVERQEKRKRRERPRKGDGPQPKHVQMAYAYDPDASAVVVAAEARGDRDEFKEVMFMRLLADAGGEHLSGGMMLTENVTTEQATGMGEDDSFLARNGAALQALARSGYAQKGTGAVVVVREGPGEGHWLRGHFEGGLPPDEGSHAYYVPLGRLIEEASHAAAGVREYDPLTQAVVAFVRPGRTTMTYTVRL